MYAYASAVSVDFAGRSSLAEVERDRRPVPAHAREVDLGLPREAEAGPEIDTAFVTDTARTAHAGRCYGTGRAPPTPTAQARELGGGLEPLGLVTE